MDDYGHVDDATPSLAMSVCEDYRGQGIGTGMLHEIMALAGSKGFKRISLSVQKANTRALKLYRSAGFESILDKGDEYIMICDLDKT